MLLNPILKYRGKFWMSGKIILDEKLMNYLEWYRLTFWKPSGVPCLKWHTKIRQH